MVKKYQLILCRSIKYNYFDELIEHLKEDFKALKLDPELDFQVLTSSDIDKIDIYDLLVGVWFGDGSSWSSEDENCVKWLVENRFIVIPIVDSDTDYNQKVPPILQPINGTVRKPIEIAADILKHFGLTREKRQMFISYKRDESRAVALQLFNAFNQREYNVFLDTASIEPGRDVQSYLMQRMADVDVLVFLHTPHALSSEWVTKELDRASRLGLGILEIMWPNFKPSIYMKRATELINTLKLDANKDMQNTNVASDGTDMLSNSAVGRIVQTVEKVRIESLGIRRQRITQEFDDRLETINSKLSESDRIQAIYHYNNTVEVKKNDRSVSWVFPIIGIPLAEIVHNTEIKHQKTDRVIYDGLGLESLSKEHLTWLNRQLRIKSIKVQEAITWLQTL